MGTACPCHIAAHENWVLPCCPVLMHLKFGLIASVLVMYEPWKWLELDLKGVEK